MRAVSRRLERHVRLRDKVLSADKRQDGADEVQITEDLDYARTLQEQLERTRGSDAVTFGHELTTQMHDMNQLTHVWEQVRQVRAESEAALEMWRIRRVKAQADSTGALH